MARDRSLVIIIGAVGDIPAAPFIIDDTNSFVSKKALIFVKKVLVCVKKELGDMLSFNTSKCYHQINSFIYYRGVRVS